MTIESVSVYKALAPIFGDELEATLHEHFAVAQHTPRKVRAHIELLHMIIVVAFSECCPPPFLTTEDEGIQLFLVVMDTIR